MMKFLDLVSGVVQYLVVWIEKHHHILCSPLDRIGGQVILTHRTTQITQDVVLNSSGLRMLGCCSGQSQGNPIVYETETNAYDVPRTLKTACSSGSPAESVSIGPLEGSTTHGWRAMEIRRDCRFLGVPHTHRGLGRIPIPLERRCHEGATRRRRDGHNYRRKCHG